MAQSNGSDSSVAASSASDRPLPGYTTFIIGGKPEQVPPLTFWTLEVRKPELDSVNTAMSLYEYADVVLKVIATSIEAAKAGEDDDPKLEDIERTFKRLRRRIIFGEMRKLGSQMDALYINSGFPAPGEVQAAGQAESLATSPGTGTSTDSSPTSQSEESVEETPSGSSGSLH